MILLSPPKQTDPVPRLFQIYKSSAGSGKTYTLVKEYLKLVLHDPSRVRHILAITFTNAAAAEMKTRIIEELGRLAALEAADPSGPDDPDSAARGRALLDQVRKEWGEDGLAVPTPGQVVINAEEVLRRILHNYSEFSVSTIDSFVHRVIRTFAFDLRLPVNFEVELEAGVLLRQAVDLLISRAGSDAALTRLLVDFILNQVEEEKDLRIERQIANLASTLMDEDAGGALNKIRHLSLDDFQRFARNIRSDMRRYEQRQRSVARRAVGLLEKSGIPDHAFSHGKNGIPGYFRKIAAASRMKQVEPNSYVKKTLEGGKWYSAKAGPEDRALIEGLRAELQVAAEQITGLDREQGERYRVLLAVGRYIFPVAVLNEVEKVLEEIKTENALLHISDFNKKIAGIVSEQPVPFIYERLGERYRHYMIDEFQDTSVLQWQNLLPLVENALAGGHTSLVVGDGKQAIYRFRNGDVEQFALLPRLSGQIRAASRDEWERTLVASAASRNLETNWRSKQEVIAFNNRFFRFASGFLEKPQQAVYDGLEQLGLEKKAGGYVEVSFVDNAGGAFRENTLAAILEAVDRCRQAGHPLGDMTILCRAGSEASLVARRLLETGVPVISSESLLLGQSDEVNFILALIRLILNPCDQVSALEAMGYLVKTGRIRQPESLHGCLLRTGLFAARRDKPPPLHGPLEALFGENGIDFRFAGFLHQNLYDTCETIVRVFFAGPGPPNPFVSFFSDAVYDFTARNRPTAADFLDWWEENGHKYSLVVPGGVDAVRVMTIHKSKGLEFPVVIFPFASQRDNKPTRAGQWVDLEPNLLPGLDAAWVGMTESALSDTPFEDVLREEQARTRLDLLNIVYVAFTRASEKLFILSQSARSYKPDTIQGMLSLFLRQEGLWREEEAVYRFGEMQAATGVPAGSPHAPSPYRRILSNPWSRALRLRSHQCERSVVIDGEDPLERGNLLHRAMEQILSRQDVEPVLKQLLSKGEVTREQYREWGEKIGGLIRQKDVAPYFEEGLHIRHEAGIFDRQGRFFRPDRVVILPGETVVIDYKTGRAYQKHREQMEQYASLLQEMGYPRVRKMILYLDSGKAEWV
jgi:ATP-dependent exoDNAse (exonuclease V) beta subunit